MRRVSLSLLAGALALTWLGCDARTPTQPLDTGPAYAISDAAHGGSVAGFYFLPPMVPQPATTGTLMGSLSPAVRICKWLDPPGTCDGVEHEFTMTDGPGGHKLVVENGQHYQLNLDTRIPELALVTGTLYRISVVLNGVVLGFADVQLEANGSTFKNLETEDVIGLVDGRTLPIKFRIEYGVLSAFNFDIAYHSNRDADPACRYNMDLYLYDRGRDLSVNLTNSPNTIDGTPSWNPLNRNRVAFASDRAHPGACAQPDVYVMDLTTGSVQRLTTAGGWKPAWSPDGNRIAFQRGWPPDCADGDENPTSACRQHDIWVMNADGSGQTQLTDVGHAAGQDPYEDHGPTWFHGPEGPDVQPAVTFARSTNANDDACPGNFDPAQPLNTCNFDIVSTSLDGNWVANHTNSPGWDQTSPARRHDGAPAFVFSAPGGGDVIALWLKPPMPTVIRLNQAGEGVYNGEADFAWDHGEILFTRKDVDGSSAIYYIDMSGGPFFPAAGPLIQNAMWGRYRPPMQP